MWAIRNSSEEFIGYIGLHQIKEKEKYIIEVDQDKKLFNESLGIVSSAINVVCNEIAFKELHLNHVFGSMAL
ncbi:4217_t:CDS:2 [Rhizophagus irregularis]|nr:4217_t:CDS:2 [Rhizophagus irregularis]